MLLAWPHDSKQDGVAEVDDGGCAVSLFLPVEHRLQVLKSIDAVPNCRCRILCRIWMPLK
jgi:hypothetical protein